MNIRTTTDPISLRDVPDPDHHPCIYEGDGDNGIEIYFESEENRQTYMQIEVTDHIVLQSNLSDSYVAEG
ncbi:MAG: hypothetical protein L0Z73_09520 [Gammaproteobacteria bacterium]|nr:hypothetical protein [Gammaproteobacteria bacterium]